MRLPVAIVRKIFGDVFRKQNVPGVPTIHHPLADVDPRSSHVDLIININHLIHRAAVNPHPQLNLWMVAERLADLNCTVHRLFWAAEKKQDHPVAGRKANELLACFRVPETFCPADDAVELLHQLDLLVHQ